MWPSGHVSSHSEKSARLHCWTRLQETSSVMWLKVTCTVSMKPKDDSSVFKCWLTATFRCWPVSPVFTPHAGQCDGSIHMHWSDPSQSGSTSHNTLLAQGPGMSKPSSGHSMWDDRYWSFYTPSPFWFLSATLLCISLEVKAREYFGLVCRSLHLSAHLLSCCCVHLHQHQASFSSRSGTRSSLWLS